MTDRSKPVAPISPVLLPSPPSHASTGAERPPPCRGCGHVHGSEGVALRCLESNLTEARGEVERLKRIIGAARDALHAP